MKFLPYFMFLVAVQANEYCSIKCGGYEHTMCMFKKGGGGDCHGYRSGVTDSEKKLIVSLHNELRQKVANGKETRGPQPAAANMMELTWDKELQAIAQRWADQCDQKGHDKCRNTLDGEQVGQNIASRSSKGMKINKKKNISKMVQAWYNEVALFSTGLIDSFHADSNFSKTGHYSQFVWAATTKVGCGIVEHNGKDGWYNIKIVCNYKVTGNMGGASVYKRGPACSLCPKGTSCSKTWPGLCA